MKMRETYPDDNFNEKIYESLFGNKLNKDIFKKKKLAESKKRLTEAPWVWKDEADEGDVVYGQETKKTEKKIDSSKAAKEIVDILFNAEDFKEECEYFMSDYGFSNPFLACCKYYRDYCEMPEEDDILHEYVDNYEEEHDCELDYNIYDLIAERIGEKACEEYGAQAYFDIHMKPSDFYNLGE